MLAVNLAFFLLDLIKEEEKSPSHPQVWRGAVYAKQAAGRSLNIPPALEFLTRVKNQIKIPHHQKLKRNNLHHAITRQVWLLCLLKEISTRQIWKQVKENSMRVYIYLMKLIFRFSCLYITLISFMQLVLNWERGIRCHLLGLLKPQK